MKKLTLLGDITPAQFLRDYWHKKPLLIRQAVPGFKPLLDFKALSELAKLDHVESRLVSQVDGHWSMQQGPLASLPSLKQKQWSLLVRRQPAQRRRRRAAAPVPLPARRAPR